MTSLDVRKDEGNQEQRFKGRVGNSFHLVVYLLPGWSLHLSDLSQLEWYNYCAELLGDQCHA